MFLLCNRFGNYTKKVRKSTAKGRSGWVLMSNTARKRRNETAKSVHDMKICHWLRPRFPNLWGSVLPLWWFQCPWSLPDCGGGYQWEQVVLLYQPRKSAWPYGTHPTGERLDQNTKSGKEGVNLSWSPTKELSPTLVHWMLSKTLSGQNWAFAEHQLGSNTESPFF